MRRARAATAPALAAALALASALILASGCKPSAAPAVDAAAAGPPPMVRAERERGVALCEHYVARVCACAAAHDAGPLDEQCALARGQPEALRLHLALLEGREGELNARERRIVEAQARAVIASCVRSDGELDPAACPRVGESGGSGGGGDGGDAGP